MHIIIITILEFNKIKKKHTSPNDAHISVNNKEFTFVNTGMNKYQWIFHLFCEVKCSFNCIKILKKIKLINYELKSQCTGHLNLKNRLKIALNKKKKKLQLLFNTMNNNKTYIYISAFKMLWITFILILISWTNMNTSILNIKEKYISKTIQNK